MIKSQFVISKNKSFMNLCAVLAGLYYRGSVVNIKSKGFMYKRLPDDYKKETRRS